MNMNEAQMRTAKAMPAPIGDRPGRKDEKLRKKWQRANRDEPLVETLTRINRNADRSPGVARRAQHRKHHGCVKATFRVPDGLPPDLRHGIFATPGEYRALIRFSNGRGEDDRDADSHGMAIKLLGPVGSNAPRWDDGLVQDFVLADHETFPSAEPQVLVLLNRLLSGRGWSRAGAFFDLLLFHLPTLVRSRNSFKTPSSVLDISYFSAIPYRLGDHAVKYFVVPCDRTDAGLGVSTRDGLAEDLRDRLGAEGAHFRFDFGVDIRVDADAQPIEDPSMPWSVAPEAWRECLAEIAIDAQEFNEAGGWAENLAFSPWHARLQNEPIGRLAEVRRDVYQSLSIHRHACNGIEPVASTGAPETYADGRPKSFGPLYWNAPDLNWLERLALRLKEDLANRVKGHAWLVPMICRVGLIQRLINWSAINYFASKTRHRPLPLSLRQSGSSPIPPTDTANHGACVSWSGLVDRSFTGRHLPPLTQADTDALPPLSQINQLFARRLEPVASSNTSALFCFFAQWLTDSFLRTHPDDRQRNTSSQELDLCQIYGLGEEATRLLRSGEGGRLKSRPHTPVGELPPLLVNSRTLKVKREFERIAFDPANAASFATREPPHGRARDLAELLKKAPGLPPHALDPERWSLFYAGGLERGSSTILYSALNTLFLREHNRLAGALQRTYATHDDDWLFETARNINIVKYLKIIVEDYINHIVPNYVELRMPQGRADRCIWYRSNRITLEFNLLYRWHSLAPDQLRIGHQLLDHETFRYNNRFVEEHGIEALFDAASRQPAGRLQLHNTPDFLLPAEAGSVRFARQFRLAGFNAYRIRWGLKPYGSFLEMTGDPLLAAELEAVYGSSGVDRVELPVGLFAEQRDAENSVLPSLLGSMVASDAFSHALTNPLLAANVYGPDALSEFGVDEIARFGRDRPGLLGAARGLASLQQLVRDNSAPGKMPGLASFDLHPADEMQEIARRC